MQQRRRQLQRPDQSSGFTCDAASNACKANVVGCTLPSRACTDDSQTGKGCFYARTISRKTAAVTTTITADTCSFSDSNNFSIDGCAVDGATTLGIACLSAKESRSPSS